MLEQRRKCWANVVQMLYKCLVLGGMVVGKMQEKSTEKGMNTSASKGTNTYERATDL